MATGVLEDHIMIYYLAGTFLSKSVNRIHYEFFVIWKKIIPICIEINQLSK